MTTAVCYSTKSEAAVAARWLNTRLTVRGGVSGLTPLMSSFNYQAIGKHCDGYCDGPGASLIVNGTNCSGGGLTFSTAWINRIGENQHKKCGKIVVYNLDGFRGTSYATTGPYNSYRHLNAMDNLANSATYSGPVN